MNTVLHKKRLKTFKLESQQLFLNENKYSSFKSEFNKELTEAMISADIPFWKLENLSFTNFLKKWTGQNVPSESLIRKVHLKVCYEEKIDFIKNKIKGKKVWVSIDETTDACGRYTGHFIIGILSNIKEECQSFLINTQNFEVTNSTTIARFFEDTIGMVSPHVIDRNDILLVITDAAPYMIKAVKALNVLYPKMMHVTCLVHILHRVCEEIRFLFPNIDSLISNAKKIFTKSSYRNQIFKEILPDVPLPSKPVITRWGTWLSATKYYCEYFDKFKRVINELDAADASSIRICKELMEKVDIKDDLAFINANYGYLPRLIEKLDLYDSIATYENIIELIENVQGEIGNKITTKFRKSLSKNVNYKNICCISRIIYGLKSEEANPFKDYSPDDISSFKFAPVTSCEVERSFSIYKSFLRPNRHGITTEHIKYYMITHFNK